MLRIAITGGVACGKTTVCGLLRDLLPLATVSYFSCDAAASEMLSEPEAVRRILAFGGELGLEESDTGAIDRARMRELLFENSEFRAKVESVVHPLVLKAVDAHLTGLSDETRIALIEVPLLYEVDFPVRRDLELVVASAESTQETRLRAERGLDSALAKRIIRSQLPIEEKMERANIVVWNDGDRRSLESQAGHLAARCERLFH